MLFGLHKLVRASLRPSPCCSMAGRPLAAPHTVLPAQGAGIAPGELLQPQIPVLLAAAQGIPWTTRLWWWGFRSWVSGPRLFWASGSRRAQHAPSFWKDPSLLSLRDGLQVPQGSWGPGRALSGSRGTAWCPAPSRSHAGSPSGAPIIAGSREFGLCITCTCFWVTWH